MADVVTAIQAHGADVATVGGAVLVLLAGIAVWRWLRRIL